MGHEDKISEYKELASTYDNQVREYDSYGHDVLFGMSFEYVKTGETLLDIGIGTGLASVPFSRVGLKVDGLDVSEEMLNACRSKSFTRDLKMYNITNEKIPYEANYFDHVVGCGVLHFVGDLEILFGEVNRVMKPGGIFAFTIAPHETGVSYTKGDTSWGVSIFKHSYMYIMNLLGRNNFKLQKEQRLLVKGADKTNHNMLFSVLVTKYQ